MISAAKISHQLHTLSLQGVTGAFYRSLAKARYGRYAGDRISLLRLYNRTFDFELALCSDFCAVPPGWLECHAVLLPAVFQPVRHDQIQTRLERMLHAPRDKEAISAILAAVSYVTDEKVARRRRRVPYIISVRRLADQLFSAQASNGRFVDALLHGHLGSCADMIASHQLVGMGRKTAEGLLLDMTRMWALHDLQIISAKLHQSIYRPTSGLFEGLDAGSQSFQAVMRDPKKMGEMAAIALRLLNRDPQLRTPEEVAEQRKFIGFMTGTDFKSVALQLGLQFGFTADELNDAAVVSSETARKAAKVFRRFTQAAKVAGQEIDESLDLSWDDRAPVGNASGPKRVSHLSPAAIRYGLDAPAALAYAVLVFIDVAKTLPRKLRERIDGVHPAAASTTLFPRKLTRDDVVTFERMFEAYRLIFLRDVNSLNRETRREMQLKEASSVFASKAAVGRARYQHVMGQCASVIHRLGAIPLTAPHGTVPGISTGYGRSSLAKARATMKRDDEERHRAYDPAFTPAVNWRFEK